MVLVPEKNEQKTTNEMKQRKKKEVPKPKKDINLKKLFNYLQF